MKPLKNKTNTVPAGGDYPYGDLKDNPGDNSGTPVDRNLLGDIHRNIEKIMDVSGIVANNLDDNESNGYQIYDAFIKAIRGYRVTTFRFNPTDTGNEVTVIRDELGFGTPLFSKISVGNYIIKWSNNSNTTYLNSLTLTTTSLTSGFINQFFGSSSPLIEHIIETKNTSGAPADLLFLLSGVIIEIRDYN